MKRRLIVGLTGSFGSGKSTVGRLLKRLGARKVIDCDQLAHEAFHNGHPSAKKIKLLFHVEGSLNRKAIRQKVFSDSVKRKQLEAIIHPYVYQRIRSELARVRGGIVVLEVPLLFETGFDRYCDVTVAVLAGERNIVRRLSRAGFDPAGVRARLEVQLPEREKKRRADLYIHNSSSESSLIRKTKLIWQKLTAVLNEKIDLRGA